MLQRQIMFKQLQELQRRQQLQDLSGGRNQDYISLKQASPVQFAPTVNGASVHDSQMLMVDSMQMIQQGESSIFRGFPSGLVLSQNHSNALGSTGLSSPQFGMSISNTPAPNTDKNLNLYSHLQDPSNHSVNLSTKNTNSPLGMSSVHPSALASSFISQQDSFSSDQISMPDGFVLPNQVHQVKNLFGGIPFQSSNTDHLSLNYSPQGITTQKNTSFVESEGRHEDTGWPAISPGKVSKIGMSKAVAPLDPLEQKILYSTDDHSWESSLGISSKMGTGGFDCTVENPSFMDTFPSIQSGSWSALMQSAVAETSSSDTGVQEDWSGLSFQKPEPSSDNQPSNFVNSEKPQNNWVDRNLQNVSSPSSEPEQLFQKSSMKCSFPGFQQSGHQHLNQKDEFHCEASHASGQRSPSIMSHLADYNSQLKHPPGGSQLVQTYFPSEDHTWPAQYKESLENGSHQPNILPSRNKEKPCINFSGHELKDALWHPGSSSNSVSGGTQMPFDQLNQLNIHRYSLESQKMNSGENAEPISTHLGASADVCGQNVTAQSRPHSQGFEFRPGPADSGTLQSYSLFPSMSMGNSSGTCLPSHYEKDFSKIQHPAPSVPSHMQDKAKSDLDAVQVGVFLPGENKGWNFSQEAKEDESGKASSAPYLQNFLQMEMLGQDDSQNHSIGSNKASNVAHQSQISLQMAPSWFKHHGTLKNGQVLPMCNPRAAITAAQPFSGLSIGKLQENSLIMQINSANASQGSDVCPSPAATWIASKHLSPSSTLPSDVTYQNLAVSKLKKRKIVAFDMVPWHKEVNCEAMRPQNISFAEFGWAQASNRRVEEATNEAEIVDDVLPVVRAKRRLIFTTQLMQQVFRPAPAGILFEDASSNCELLAYYAVRLALGDACNLNTKLPSDTNDVSPDKLNTSKRTAACDFSKVVECLISRVKKLEGDLSRLDQNLSIVDVKVESQELDKFSTLNCFAKFHIKALPSTVNPASSSGPSTVRKTTPRRYVIAVPMPKILPEVTDCLPL